jgi:hypothetical protein
MRSLIVVSVAAVLTAFAPAAASAGASPSATIVGTVTLAGVDGDTFAGGGARVVLACWADRTTRTEVADDHGAFRFLNVPVDSCSIEADVQGFAGQPVRVVTAAQQVVETELLLDIAPLRAGVSVGGPAPFQAPKTLTRSCRADAGRRLERSVKSCITRKGIPSDLKPVPSSR